MYCSHPTIFQLFKNKGSSDDHDNYRNITILSCIVKLSAKCLNNRLTAITEGADVLGEEQAGLREGYSSTEHISVLHSIIDF